MQHQIQSLLLTALSCALFSLLVSAGIRKNGSTIVSLQKPIPMAGMAVIALREPEHAPQITAMITAILAYFAIKFVFSPELFIFFYLP